MNKKDFTLTQKNKKLRSAEIIICIAIVLAVILPNVVGTTMVPDLSGDIKGKMSLNGLKAAVTDNEGAKSVLKESYPDSAQKEYPDIDAAKIALKNEESDYLVCTYEEALTLRDENPDLTIVPGGLSYDDPEYFAVIKKSRFMYGATTKKLADLNEGTPKIGMLAGADDETTVLKSLYPNAEFSYYAGLPDIIKAVSVGLVDYGSAYDKSRERYLDEYDDIASLPELYLIKDLSFLFPKTEDGKKLCDEFDIFFEKHSKTGEIARIREKWESGDESRYVMEKESYKADNPTRTIRIATVGIWQPMSFVYNNEITGYFIELSNMFCEEYGYTPEFYIADFAAEMAGVAGGEYDMVADIANYTEERAKSVLFSTTIHSEGSILVTKADPGEMVAIPKAGFFAESLKNSFERNFIEQNRYIMILNGIKVTVLISVLSMIFGTILGGIICFCRMSKRVYPKAFSLIYIKVVQGLPIVVLLMLLCYVVFAGFGIDAMWICIIGFSLDFSAYASEIFRTNIEAVPKGQSVAARALGFSEFGAFKRVVFPQALVGILPVYRGQVISLIKMTSVAGYIAVVDLTRASDLIRNATYEALFPLITTAIIYFALSSLVALILRLVEIKVTPRKEKSGALQR